VIRSATPIPQHSFTNTETRDALEHTLRISGWRDTGYEHVGRQPFHAHLVELCLWPLQIILERMDQSCVYRGGPWTGGLTFLSKLTSNGELYCSGRRIDDTSIAVFPWDFSNSASLSGKAHSVLIVVDQDALADHARSVFDIDIMPAMLRRGRSITDASTVSAFQRCALTLLDDLSMRPELLDSESYRTATRAHLLNMLVSLLDSGTAARPLSPPSTRSYVLEKADEYMYAKIADPLDISELCESIRVSPRTLRYSFEEMVGVSPTHYLQALRLGRVRRELLQLRSATQIRCIAERHGFAHMGRFAQAYADAFGELPSHTCRRARNLSSA